MPLAKRPDYIRLLPSPDAARTKALGRAEPRKQLTLPYLTPSSVLLVDANLLDRGQFYDLVKAAVPRWIFDVRVVPRLDTLAGSRSLAFSMFENAKASYVDLFGRLGITSYHTADANPALWIKAAVDLLKQSKQHASPCLFIFDAPDQLDVAIGILQSALKPVIGKKITVAIWNPALQQ